MVLIQSLVERELARAEVELVWTIDRAEVIEAVYYAENGGLVLKPEHWDVRGWPPGEPEKYMPILLDCFDRRGWFYGLFDGSRLAGLTILESEFIGKEIDQLQMKFLHVSRAYRQQGLAGCSSSDRLNGRGSWAPGRCISLLRLLRIR